MHNIRSRVTRRALLQTKQNRYVLPPSFDVLSNRILIDSHFCKTIEIKFAFFSGTTIFVDLLLDVNLNTLKLSKRKNIKGLFI